MSEMMMAMKVEPESADAANKPFTLVGPWLFIGRATWVVLVLFVFVVQVSLISRLGELLLVGDAVSNSYSVMPREISYITFSRLIQWSRYALLAVYNLAALLIFWRKSHELMGIITSLLLMLLPFWFDLGGTVPMGCCEPGSPLLWVWALAIFGLFLTILFFNLFPSGRFTSAWGRRLFRLGTGLFGVGVVIGVFFPEQAEAWGYILPTGALIGLLLLGIVGQCYRYVRVSGPIERLQTRWVVASLALVIFWLMAVYTRSPFRSWSPWAGPWALLQIFGTFVVLAFVPLSIARAILRYRLWDIDIIVRKTLVYALLTGFLILVYFTSIVVLQSAFSRLTGQDSTLATILSTLLIAALFLPLRRRIQGAIDRRFYRRKYDAQKTLEQFAHTARDETDLEKLTTELLRVIQETMEPEHVSVWLKPVGDGRPRSTDDGLRKPLSQDTA